MNEDQTNNILISDLHLVRLNKPEEIIHKPMKTSTKQVKHTLVKNVDSLDLDENVAERLKCNDVLNRIWPPREWEKDGKLYRQTISNQPAIAWEVNKLIENLNTHLEQLKAREVGICPIRREIYRQCFDEIIRQETLNCAERGHVLVQIRDEIKTTIDAYQELNESVIANRIRRTLMQEQNNITLETTIVQLTTDNEKLKDELAEMNSKTEQIEREIAEACDKEGEHQAKELSNLKKANQMLKAQIASIIKSTKRM